jgi:hypothetical protein
MSEIARQSRPAPQPSTYRFADLTLHVGQHRLERNGSPIELGRLTYALLLALVESAPNVLTHDDLVRVVWGGTEAPDRSDRCEPAVAIEHVDAALRALELDRYLSESVGSWSLEGLLPHPAFDGMREDPRFIEFVNKHRSARSGRSATTDADRPAP